MAIANKVVAETFQTTTSFLSALEAHTRWVSSAEWTSPWVFRGQRDSNWSLTPAAWRDNQTAPIQRLKLLKQQFLIEFTNRIQNDLQRFKSTKINLDFDLIVNSYAQARAEFALILDFVKLADTLGYAVLGMHTYTNLSGYDYLQELQSFPLLRFLPDPNPAAALAQHHGIPTRLLDWTRSPLYAAYFAAEEVNPEKDEGSIAVWALRADLMRSIGSLSHHNAHISYMRFLDHTVPNGENKYLHSQEGLFIYPVYGCCHLARNGEFPDLERFTASIEQEVDQSILQKLTLPYTEVGELLRLLWLRGVSRAHLMPTLDNVTHALSSRWKWSKC